MVVSTTNYDKGKASKTIKGKTTSLKKAEINTAASLKADSFMADDIFALCMLRDASVRKDMILTMKTCVVSLGLNIILLAMLCFVALKPTSELYYWTTGDGTVHPLNALNDPVISERERERWLSRAITNTFDMDFSNYKSRIQSNRENFTEEGFKALTEAMESSGLIKSLVNYKYRLSAVPSAVPIQVKDGLLPDTTRQAWQYQLPMLLTYEAPDNKKITQNIVVEVAIIRVRESENPRGMAMARFVSR